MFHRSLGSRRCPGQRHREAAGGAGLRVQPSPEPCGLPVLRHRGASGPSTPGPCAGMCDLYGRAVGGGWGEVGDDTPAGRVPTCLQPQSVASIRSIPSQMNLSVLSCGSTSLETSRLCPWCCVCWGEGARCGAGSGGAGSSSPHCAHSAGGIGVAPSEARALLVAVVVPQGGGTGTGWGVMSSWFSSPKPGTLLPQPGEVICICKLVVVLSAMEMQTDLLFSLRLSCCFLYNKLLWGKKD